MAAPNLQQGDIIHIGYVFFSNTLYHFLKCIVITCIYMYHTHQLHMTVILSTKQVRIMNMSSLGYEYFLLLLSKFNLPNSSSLCRCLIFATFLALCLYCDFLSIPISSFPNGSDNEPDVFSIFLRHRFHHVYCM